MKKFLFLLSFIFAINLTAQERRISNYVLGVNYLKSEIINADLKMYNIHFEKQSTNNITFGGEIYFKSGTIKSGTEFTNQEIKNLYFGGPTILYTGSVFGMLHYKATITGTIGYMHHEQYDFDMVAISKSLYYGFIGKLEGLAIVSTRMQFVLGLGFMKGFAQSDAVKLDSNPFYHIGLTYMF